MSETTEQWLARIGSREAMEERQRLRLEGKLNRRVPGPYGLEAYSRLNLRTHRFEQPVKIEQKPLIVVPSTPVPKKPRKAWAQRGTSGN